ncbi:MAG: ATP-binding protein [Actinomycetota bacterium]|nr:ATP-binding protein [Nocardioidaceae bacterium]MDQ3480870.1 ATP-binding protein [Actinomycetota bacterium]
MQPDGSDRPRASAVVVTGVPGAGKTTLASTIAKELSALLLSLDEIKEDLYERDRTRDGFELRRAAEAALGNHLAAATDTVVVDIWIAPVRDTDRVISLLRQHTVSIVEVLCRVPAEVAVERYVRRPRTGPHLSPDEATLGRIREAVEVFRPLGIGKCIEIDTSHPVDVQEVLAQLRAVTK